MTLIIFCCGCESSTNKELLVNNTWVSQKNQFGAYYESLSFDTDGTFSYYVKENSINYTNIYGKYKLKGDIIELYDIKINEYLSNSSDNPTFPKEKYMVNFNTMKIWE